MCTLDMQRDLPIHLPLSEQSVSVLHDSEDVVNADWIIGNSAAASASIRMHGNGAILRQV